MSQVNGSYGSDKTPSTIFTYPVNSGAWYAAYGSQNVNFTYDTIEDGVDIEELSDVDCFNWDSDIRSEYELEIAVEA